MVKVPRGTDPSSRQLRAQHGGAKGQDGDIAAGGLRVKAMAGANYGQLRACDDQSSPSAQGAGTARRRGRCRAWRRSR